jgi:GNAT superfamily N-acetyltransferase
MAIIIREAQNTDLNILVDNNLSLALETESLKLNRDILYEGIKQALKREECHYFVAVIAGKLVGQVMITYEWSDWRNGILWWMQSVYVQPDYRKQGVFRTLFLHVKNLAHIHQVKALRLYVMNTNITGQRTYKTLGMIDSGYIVFEKEHLTK